MYISWYVYRWSFLGIDVYSKDELTITEKGCKWCQGRTRTWFLDKSNSKFWNRPPNFQRGSKGTWCQDDKSLQGGWIHHSIQRRAYFVQRSLQAVHARINANATLTKIIKSKVAKNLIFIVPSLQESDLDDKLFKGTERNH